MAYNQKYALVGQVTSVDFNATGDTLISIENANSYMPTLCILTNFTGLITTATWNIRDAASGGGNVIFSGFTGSTNYDSTTTYKSIANSTNLCTTPTLYVNVSGAEGSALTGDIYIYGLVLT